MSEQTDNEHLNSKDGFSTRNKLKKRSRWTAKDAARYKFERIPTPDSMESVDPVRIYRRNGVHYIEFWSPMLRKSRKQRIGSFTQAYMAALAVKKQLLDLKANPHLRSVMSHAGLVKGFLGGIERKVECQRVKLQTLRRYRSALRYYEIFVRDEEVLRRYPDPSKVDDEFVVEFERFLNQREVSPNGHPNSKLRPLRGSAMILSVVRAMFAEAGKIMRGNARKMT